MLVHLRGDAALFFFKRKQSYSFPSHCCFGTGHIVELLTTTQLIERNFHCLLAVVLLLACTNYRDFKDPRTPYKATVAVEFIPINKGTKLHITAINNTAPKELLAGQRIYTLPLKPDANTIEFVIHSASPTSPDTLTIDYQRIRSLISHELGAQQTYVLKKVQSTFAGGAKILNPQLSSLNESATDVQVFF